MTHPKVTVILTSYNHAPFLGAAIESVIAQSFRDFELVILDDASTDNSWEIITAFNDARIRCVRSDVPGKVLDNLNKAIREAHGEYIAIHHSDDLWVADKLEKQVRHLDAHKDVGAVFTHVQVIDEQGQAVDDADNYFVKTLNPANRTRHEWLRYFFCTGNALCHPSVLIRKQCYDVCGAYNYGAVCLGDFDMWVRLCKHFEIYILEEKLTQFRYFMDHSNASGNKQGFQSVAQFTFYTILWHFTTIQSFEELCRIFPEAREFDRGENTVCKFALAMVALSINLFHFMPLFAVNLLHDCLMCDTTRDTLQIYYNFDRNSYADILRKYDPLNVFTIDALKNRSVFSIAKERLRDTIFRYFHP